MQVCVKAPLELLTLKLKLTKLVAEATQPVDVPEYDQAESLEEHAGAKNGP